MATLVADAPGAGTQRAKRSSFAYLTLTAFSILYFARPEDVIPGLGAIPVGKITGGVALVALICGLAGKSGSIKLPKELKILLLFLGWLCIDIFFAFWRGGAFATVRDKYSKVVIVAFLVSLVVTSLAQLRRLLLIQAASVALVTVVSILRYHGGRMSGVQEGLLANPNDLAMNIALNWPLCLMFLLGTKNKLQKALWGLALFVMLRGVMLTYSRGGFLALALAMILCVWEFGLRGRRYYMLVIALLVVMSAAALAPGRYGKRLYSLVETQQGDMDRHSLDQRENMLTQSLQVTADHPVFGVGPGNFAPYTKNWLVTHNTYTQLTSECGIPALILFLLVLKRAFWNLRAIRKLGAYRQSSEVRLYTGGLWASLGPYLLGACFASTADQLFPYFMVAYTTALYSITRNSANNEVMPVASPWQGGTGRQIDREGSGELVGSPLNVSRSFMRLKTDHTASNVGSCQVDRLA